MITEAGVALLGLAAGAVAAIYRAGRTEEKIRSAQIKAKEQVDGVGRLTRDAQCRAERRWKHMIATQIETSGSLEEAKQYGRLLREDAWRD